MRYPESFKRLGLKPPSGVLLYGPPGCSKTTLVRAVANASGAAFLSVSGASSVASEHTSPLQHLTSPPPVRHAAADVFSSLLGEAERTLRELFQRAREASPAVVFLDEIDAIVGTRQEGGGDGECTVVMCLRSDCVR